MAVGGQRLRGAGNRLQQHGDVLLFGGKLVLQRAQEGLAQRFQRIGFCRRHGNHRRGFTRDSVAQGTAVQIQHAQVQFCGMSEQEARQQLVGIAQAHVDLGAGVAAFQALEGQLQRLIAGRYRFALQRQGSDEINTAGATHVDLAFFFGVGVDQDIRLQPVRL
ncbi:hypothetical protein D3C79_235250 [compost metagenome]